ncbi:FAD-dependent oxidoreductase [Streptomyces cirratus]
MVEQPSVAVIGAGVAGLTAAYILSASREVTLYEADGRLAATPTPVNCPCPTGRRWRWTRGSSCTTNAPTPPCCACSVNSVSPLRTPR